MGIYAPGTSIKTVILDGYNDINKVLAKSDLDENLKDIIRNHYKEVCYQWCQTNASAVAFEERVKSYVSDNDFLQLTQPQYLIGKSTDMLKETYPQEFFED